MTISPKRVLGEVKYFSGGAGLVSTAADYARFLQMLLNEGELDGVRLLKPETVRDMTRNQIGELDCAYTIHGDKFGLGFGIVSAAPGDSVATPGSYSWGGMYHTFFWVDPARELVALVMTQIYPWGESTLWPDFQKAVYEAIGPALLQPACRAAPDLRPRRQPPAASSRKPGSNWARSTRNPAPNNRFRVNDPPRRPASRPRQAVRNQGQRPAADPARRAPGRHPRRRAGPGTLGRPPRHRPTSESPSMAATPTTIPEVGTAAGNCTHLYPVIRLERSDLVQAHNAFQFACDRGDSFWGHFIVDNAALRVELPPWPQDAERRWPRRFRRHALKPPRKLTALSSSR